MQLGAYALERMGQAAELRRAAETLYGSPIVPAASRSDWRRCGPSRCGCRTTVLTRCVRGDAAAMSEGNERLGQPFAAMEAMSDAADSLVRAGALRRARPVAEEAVARARRLQGAWAALRPTPVLMGTAGGDRRVTRNESTVRSQSQREPCRDDWLIGWAGRADSSHSDPTLDSGRR